jgi:hypothetical protein
MYITNYKTYIIPISLTLLAGFTAWISTHLYVQFCAPTGIHGFIQSLLMMDSSFCRMILSVMNHHHNLYGIMITGIVGVLVKVIHNTV